MQSRHDFFDLIFAIGAKDLYALRTGLIEGALLMIQCRLALNGSYQLPQILGCYLKIMEAKQWQERRILPLRLRINSATSSCRSPTGKRIMTRPGPDQRARRNIMREDPVAPDPW